MRHYLVFIVLAACATTAPLPEPAEDTCNAGAYDNLIGQQATALERVLLLGAVRVIRPNDAVTMDFRPERINFMIGADESITRIRCG